MSRSVLCLEGAHKAYRGGPALRGVDLELAAGEWVALLGPNGAGKTTLMRTIAGVEALDRGRVRLPARVGRRGSVGFVPQEVALYDRLTTRENLELFGRLHGLDRREVRPAVERALDWTALRARAGDRVAALSGGMQRRLNIACSVLHRPPVLLLDEPTVGIDPQSRYRIWEMLRGLLGDGTAILQSTHELDEIETLADRTVILDRGRVLAEGSREQLLGRAGSERVPLRLRLDRPAAGIAAAGLVAVGDGLEGSVSDPIRQLPAILAAVEEHGAAVRELSLRSPGLQEVFAALTGRELRE